MVAPLSAVGVIRYHRPTKNFAKIRNAFHRDARVKPRAAKVGAYILTHADGFSQTQLQLAFNTGLSVMTVRAALDDLTTLRYMARRVIRERGRVVGTAYAMADTPFTEDELVQLAREDVPSEPRTESVHTGSVAPKKIRSRRDSSTSEEDQPSGGSAAADPPEPQEDDPMPKTPISSEPALFELPAPEPPPAEATKSREPGPAQVVAAFVDSHREFHGSNPTRSEIGRVARDAKKMIDYQTSAATLIQAAQAMGRTPFANLSVQLKKLGKMSTGKGIAPPLRDGAPEWVEGTAATAAEARAAIAADPALAAWMATA